MTEPPSGVLQPLTYGGKMTVRFTPLLAVLGEPYTIQVTVENVGTADCCYVLRWLRFSQPDAVVEKHLDLAVGDSVTYTFKGIWDRPGRRLFDFHLGLDAPDDPSPPTLETVTKAVYVHSDRVTTTPATPFQSRSRSVYSSLKAVPP